MHNNSLVWGSYCTVNEAGNMFLVYVDDDCNVTEIRWYVSPSYSRDLSPDQWDKVVIKPEAKEMITTCKTHSGFNAAINNRSLAKFTVAENYKHTVLIRAMLKHGKALFTVTTENGQRTFEITGYAPK